MKISIIIPTYNREDLILRALLSIKADSISNGENQAEIIVVDDGGDSTENKVAEFKKNYPKIEIIYIKRAGRMGVNSARNEGVKTATSEWVCFLDSDDEYVEGGLQIIFDALSCVAGEIGVVGFMTQREVNGVMVPRGYKISEKWSTYSPTYEDVVMKNDIRGDIHHCFRREIFSAELSFPEEIQGLESFFFCRLAKKGIPFLYVNKIVDRRYTDGYEHLGDYERWPRQYAKYFKLFVAENWEVLEKHTKKLAHFYGVIASSSLRVLDPRGFYWLIKLWLLKIKNRK